MDAMQYTIPLPADYDMGIIRERVARNGHRLDAFPGLGLKAYLMRARGGPESVANDYAPFYLWADTAGMARFLWQREGFGAVVAGFGRPAVRHWTGAAVRRGTSALTAGRFARRWDAMLPADEDPQAAVAALVDEAADLAARPGVALAAAAVDASTWAGMLFALMEAPEVAPGGTLREVLHLSAPDLDRIAAPHP